MIKDLVSTIVLNWNDKEYIFDCLESLLAQTYSPQEIILVDNGSTDGSLPMLKEKYGSSINIICNAKNLGFAGGVNAGIYVARGEYIALLNSDAVAKENWIEELVAGMRRRNSVGMCASKIYLAGRQGILDNTGEVICRDGLARGRGRLEKDEGQYDNQEETLCPSGCAALYRRKMLEEAGWLDNHFFAYAEDIDIGLRGRILGYACVYIPTALVHHHFSASSGMVSALKAFYVERNRLWVALKCFPMRYLAISPFYTALRYFYHLYGLWRRQGPAFHYVKKFSSIGLFLILIKGYLSTLIFCPYLIRERIKLRRKSRTNLEEFGRWLRDYGISPREAALSELA